MYNVHTHYSSQKLNSKICNVSEEFSSAQRAWIYFIQNTAKAVILGNILLFKTAFYWNIFAFVIYSCDLS